MEVTLAKNEQIIKSWDYSIKGHRFDKHKLNRSLTVTNKRIIASEEGDYELRNNEVKLSAVKSISGTFRKNDSLWMRIKFALSIFFSIIIIGIIFGSIGSAIRLNREIKSCIFELHIRTQGYEGTSLTVGAAPETGISKRKHFFSKSINKIKIYVDKQVAREILTEVGAIILANEQ